MREENCINKFGSAHDLSRKLSMEAKQTTQSWNQHYLSTHNKPSQPGDNFYDVCNLLQYNLFSTKTTPKQPAKKQLLPYNQNSLNQIVNKNYRIRPPSPHPLGTQFYLKAEQPKFMVRKEAQAKKRKFHSHFCTKVITPQTPIRMNESLNNAAACKIKVAEPKRVSMFELELQELQLNVKPAKEDKFLSPWSIY